MQQLVDAFFRAAKDKDVSALDALFAEDAVYVERNGETYNGLAQIKVWFSRLVSDGEEAFVGKGHQRAADAELKKLRKEYEKLKMENEILKKAAAYFAKHPADE